jgi:hypothetical protein
MALVRNFVASTSTPNQIELNWTQPLDFNNVDAEIIVTRTITHYPTELFNANFPNKATDNRPIEIFRGKNIVGTNVGSVVVSGNTLTDTLANFPTNPNLNGRLLRDSVGQVFRILSNTSNSVILDNTPSVGKYIILAEFPSNVRDQQNFENDLRTIATPGAIENLVELINGSFQIANFLDGELINCMFKDANGDKYIVKYNTQNKLFFYETAATPLVGIGMSLLPTFADGQAKPFIDTFKTDVEAAARVGTGLLDNQFYYYTAFTKLTGTNVAQAEYSSINSGTSTQSSAISIKDRDWGDILYNYWPNVYKTMDTTGDLEDLMHVFAYQFAEIHSLIETYTLQNSDTVFVNALLPLSEQTGLPSVGFTIGADTLRRIAKDMISAWHLKGSKEGIALFIRIITTWDITNGTGDFSGSISDFLPNVSALRFFDPNLGSTNVRLTQSSPFIAGGRFAKSLPGIVIPGLFTFREFVVTLPNVALYLGDSSGITITNGNTILTDSLANYGATNNLVGNFLLPNQGEINDIFQIIANTSNSITVRGVVNNKTPGGRYAVLSPLNTNRFIILNKLLPGYVPFGTKAGFNFT